MKKKPTYTHPMNLYPQKINEEGIVVFNDVRGLPSGDEPFVSTDYVICIGHKGRINLMYDDIADCSEQRTVGVIFPNHRLLKVDKTDDYRATLIVVRASLLNDPMLQIINQLRYRYEPHPNVKLDRHEYKMITSVVEGMCEITRLQLPDRRMLMTRLLEFLLRLLSHYRKGKLNETLADKRVSARFLAELKQHIRQHREVSFYAEKACLSSKHFSAVVKQETGQNAAYWIHRQVVAEAKMLLHVRRDLSVQIIADMLGFEEQSTFSRYFRRETGMSPTEFRNSE
ncbi:MAG: AraC family transcriptional regulator [Bacteroidales bacterium]|nr:AraC family transcriptional regulator [Bacteroidales bacterium]